MAGLGLALGEPDGTELCHVMELMKSKINYIHLVKDSMNPV